MEAMKTKKTGLHGKSKNANAIRGSLPPDLTHRPSYKEHVKSAPRPPHDTQLMRAGLQPPLSRRRRSLESALEVDTSSPPASPRAPIQDTSDGRLTDDEKKSVDACELQEVVVALLSTAGVGKSTFVQCALDLKRAVDSPISSKKVSLEGSISVVRLVELDIGQVHIVNDSVCWPKTIEGGLMPAIDGALVLYNVMDQQSMAPIAPLLSESTSLSLA